jgi:hypothetical protein
MHRQNRNRDGFIALFVLGVFLLLPPFLLVFNHPVGVLGIPVLYLYLFLAWGLLIVLGAAVSRHIPDAEASTATLPEPPSASADERPDA